MTRDCGGATATRCCTPHAGDALGDRFDLRSFHDAVLGHGQLPLPALTEVVPTWIDERIAGPKGWSPCSEPP